MEPARQLRRLVTGYQVTQALHVVATLGISDALACGPRDADELAQATSTHAPTLRRLMRALEGIGIYRSDDEGRYANTELGELLRSDLSGSLLGWAAFVGRPPQWQAWAALNDSVRTGANAFQSVHGMAVWEYHRQRPEERETFDRAMTSISGMIAQGVVDSYDFSRFGTIVDVGGGAGKLLVTILARYPDAHGVLFDQPEVVAAAPPMLVEADVSHRCEVVGGSFFEALPAGGDAYLLKSIIHDWPDAESIEILRRCRRAMRDDATLLLVEQLIGQGPDPVLTAFSDLNMLVGPGGQERTLDEYAALFEASGFILSGAIETGTQVFVVEATPQAS